VFGFTSYQLSLSHTITDLVKANEYGFRYRSLNEYGWSDYSPVTYLLMAVEPHKAQKPVFVSATETTLTVDLIRNVYQQGDSILEYELSVGTDGLTYDVLTNYDGQSDSFELDVFRDELQSGQIYRLRYRARNSIGWGEYSSDLLAAITAPPIQPNQPVRVDSLSSKTSIAIKWDAVSDNFGEDGARVTGYRVYMATEFGVYTMVYDGREYRDMFTHLAEGLSTGKLYKLKVSAYNFNGEGPTSDVM
jgi:hypothetical protein